MKLLPFSYPWIIKKHIDNASSILDIGCGDGALMDLIINKSKKNQIIGIELFNPYIKAARAKGIYTKIVKSDIRKIKFKDKSFDTVLASQVIEHITKKEGFVLITNMEKLARSKVVISTPNGFFHRDENFENNRLQRHHSGWSILDFKRRGYKVYGQGVGLIYKQEGILNESVFSFYPLRLILYTISYMLSPLVYFFPEYSAHIVAIKYI